MKPRVLVTGGTGFVGSHLVRLLQLNDYEVAVLLRPDGTPRRIADLLPSCQVIWGDLSDVSRMSSSVFSFQPEVVLHFAWTGVGGQARNEPTQVHNATNSMRFLELVADAGCKCYIAAGSQAEYGPWPHAITEETATRPTTLYGSCKLQHCLESAEFCAQRNIRFAWLRLFSLYGPDDSPDWMIPYVITTIAKGLRPALTAGEQRWDYLYVEDAAEAILAVLMQRAAQGIFNLGSGQCYRLRMVIEELRDLINPSVELGFGDIPYRTDQVMYLLADISKLTKATGWHPQTSIFEGLRRTVSWYTKAT